MRVHLASPARERAASSSIRVTRSQRECRSSRPAEPSTRSQALGVARSVHSRATAKLPRSASRRISVSTPATHRAFSTAKRWPLRGWNGCRISAQPEGSLGDSAVDGNRASESFYQEASASCDETTSLRGGDVPSGKHIRGRIFGDVILKDGEKPFTPFSDYCKRFDAEPPEERIRFLEETKVRLLASPKHMTN